MKHSQQDFVRSAPFEIITRVANLRYFNEFWSLRCKFDLMEREIYPNPKEITESMTAYNAIRKYLRKDFDFNDPDVVCICVGDGRSPRTGAMVAFRSKWQVFSVDPILKHPSEKYNIDRLTCMPYKIEDVPTFKAKKVIVLAVHSHASLPATLDKIQAEQVAVVALPCCTPLEVPGQGPDYDYRDWGCWSPENRVKVWRNVQRPRGEIATGEVLDMLFETA